jgi:hypothetical protein
MESTGATSESIATMGGDLRWTMGLPRAAHLIDPPKPPTKRASRTLRRQM